MANGDVDEVTAQGSKKCDTIVLTGKQENCDKAKEALLVSGFYLLGFLPPHPPPFNNFFKNLSLSLQIVKLSI